MPRKKVQEEAETRLPQARQGVAANGEPQTPSEDGQEAKGGFFGRLPALRQRAQALAGQGMDDAGIAVILKEPLDRVQKYLAKEMEYGRAMLKARILRAQLECAVQDRDAVMLKRLGEEFCGQGVITQKGAVSNAGKQVFVLNVGTPPKDLDGPPPGPVRTLPERKTEVVEAEFEDVEA